MDQNIHLFSTVDAAMRWPVVQKGFISKISRRPNMQLRQNCCAGLESAQQHAAPAAGTSCEQGICRRGGAVPVVDVVVPHVEGDVPGVDDGHLQVGQAQVGQLVAPAAPHHLLQPPHARFTADLLQVAWRCRGRCTLEREVLCHAESCCVRIMCPAGKSTCGSTPSPQLVDVIQSHV